MSSTKSAADIPALKQACPLPVLLKKLGLGAFAKASCSSPLRTDTKPSWGIYQRDARWFWKDHATGDGGDEIAFLAALKGLNQKANFKELLKIYQDIASSSNVESAPPFVSVAKNTDKKPDRNGFCRGTHDQLTGLGVLRGYEMATLEFLQEKGLLVFGSYGGQEVFGLTDQSGRVLELRRLDGLSFPGNGCLAERKSHSVKHSQKSWPIGILESTSCETLILVEGCPDFIAGWEILLNEKVTGRAGVVSMLGAACKIAVDALCHFKGKHVRIVPHQDAAGIEAAERWTEQLTEAGAAKIDYLDLALLRPDHHPFIKDLDDAKVLHHTSDWRLI